MKTDSDLSELLRVWKVEPTPAPGFQRAVWSRIERQKARHSRGVFSILREWFVVKLPQPLHAATVIALFLLSGLGLANLAASRIERLEAVALKERYLTSIDPLAKAGEELRRP
ncbi:hypothetical protein OH491_22730 [Termitidicoccus mucosus]|uniref:Uncharacterized protein n=1 Tax=Termitidicoccus mucosus TaxID=1184151 RepID=A0A178IN58_9BACT|nr:hypothetical protein AW736_03740 [Opitutaceae bacterium TSB47]